MPSPPRIRHITLPFGLGRYALVRDNGEARFAAGVICATHLLARIYRQGRLADEIDLGSGLITVAAVNLLVSDSVTGSSVAPALARMKYQALGTGSTPASDGDSALETEAGPPTRATAALTNGQTATTGNHAAKLVYTATTNLTAPIAITEWGLLDTASGAGTLLDHKVFSVINLGNGDAYQGIFALTLSSNG